MAIITRSWHRARAVAGVGIACLALMAATLFTATTADAAPRAYRFVDPGLSQVPYVVRSDYGGSVQTRLRDISALRASGRKVEIRGDVCMSSCTMLLGLQNACVHPATTFGFHGPSRNGAPLDRSLFNQISWIIAGHYPADLRIWYITVARHTLTDVHTLKGAELIRMGAAKSCVPAVHPATRSPHV